MSFQPQIPISGVPGWRFLQRTQPVQQAAFENAPEIARDLDYFKANIGKITSAEELVADRRLLKVALGAFGLEGEIDKKAYIRKVLDEGTADPRAFANRIADPAYRKLAAAFGFGNPGGSRTAVAGFDDKIVADYKTRAFEVAVGEANESMRFALNFRREMAELSKQGPEGASWFTVLGSKPLRKVLEAAFNLPESFGRLDVDRQREVMREKTSAMFGTANLTAFAAPANVEKAINRFLIRAQMDEGPSPFSRGSAALTLLRGGSDAGSQGLFNILASRR